ncbi:unnamed protein product [Prunus armeniaca]
MPGLDRKLVEHKLPIKEGYLPVKQARRIMSMDTELKVKEEIERLLKAGFIRPAVYVDCLANIVPVLKRKTRIVRICVDYRNLNEASPKDEYPMPMADMLVDGAAHNHMLSFMDGNAGYNQIMVAEEDIHKTAFMCPRHIGAFEYTVMPFGLRNIGATYQRAMNSVFHDMIGHSLEVYIDDVVIKSPEKEGHVSNLRKTFLRMRQHKLKQEQIFKWEEQHQQGFEKIKHYLSNPPVLSPPKRGRPLKLYVSASEVSIGSLLVQDNKEGKEQAVYYLSRTLTEVERKYSAIEWLCLALYFTAPSGAGIVLEEPLGIRHCYSFQLDFQCTNNRAEYEALIIKLEIQVELGIQSVEILGDSMLVLKQIAGEYKCLSPSLAVYLVAARNLLTEFREASWEHIPREENFASNELAQVATGIQIPEDYVQRIIKVGKKSLPSVLTRGMEIDVNSAIITEDDWRNPIINYLQYPTLPYGKRVRIMALNYHMWSGDLVRKSKNEVLLRCLGKQEYMKVMGETH